MSTVQTEKERGVCRPLNWRGGGRKCEMKNINKLLAKKENDVIFKVHVIDYKSV